MRLLAQLDRIAGKVNVWLLVIALGLGAFDLGALLAMSFTRLPIVSDVVSPVRSPAAYRPMLPQSRDAY